MNARYYYEKAMEYLKAATEILETRPMEEAETYNEYKRLYNLYLLYYSIHCDLAR